MTKYDRIDRLERIVSILAQSALGQGGVLIQYMPEAEQFVRSTQAVCAFPDCNCRPEKRCPEMRIALRRGLARCRAMYLKLSAHG